MYVYIISCFSLRDHRHMVQKVNTLHSTTFAGEKSSENSSALLNVLELRLLFKSAAIGRAQQVNCKTQASGGMRHEPFND